MDKTEYDAYRFCSISVVIFGILGNTVVIISISRQRKLLKNNYYFFVSHLAICDLAYLVGKFLNVLNREFLTLFAESVVYCLVSKIRYVFLDAGIYMMLIISILRYCATIYPLRSAVSRRKLEFAVGFGYIFGLITGYGVSLPRCFLQESKAEAVYLRVYFSYVIICFYFFPTFLMSVVYFKIYRALIKQNKQMKRVCSNAVRSRYVRNRRTFLVCVGTVLCYGFGILPNSLWFLWWIASGPSLPMKDNWIRCFGSVLRVTGSNSVNPLIYGVLDKKLLKFWKLCARGKRATQES